MYVASSLKSLEGENWDQGVLNNVRKYRRSIAVAVAIFALCGINGVTPAGADEIDSTQQAINEVLAKTEGGIQVSRYEIAWDGGQAIEAFPLPGETHAPPPSDAAQELQAKISGLPLSTRETAPEMQPYDDPADNPLADEPVPDDELNEPDVGTTAADTCPTVTFGNDWYCFYQYKNFGGRRLQWSAVYNEEAVMFSRFLFVNRTSSWSNKGGLTINVYGRTVSGQDWSCYDLLWREYEHERSAEATPDNKADCFRTTSS